LADRNFYPSQSYGFAKVYCDFQFPVTNTVGVMPLVFSGQAGTQNVWGIGADVLSSITFANTGVYTLQFQQRDHYNKIISSMADVSDDGANNAGAYATAGSHINEGTNLGIGLTVRTYTAGGAASNLTVAAGHVIKCMLVLRNSAATNPA
jgi:hypothetical protein